MSAILTWICDECGHLQTRDVTSDAAAGCRVFAGYPDGWYVGLGDKDACQNTTCQAQVMQDDNPASDYDPTGDDL